MALLINQGKQDTSADKQFEPFEEKDVVVAVEKIELNTYLSGNIDVTLRLMSGAHKNWTRRDTISYEATSPFSWKYRAFRECCNVPYKEDEPAQIDIEALVKDKMLIADFTISEKDGKKNQRVSYRKIDQKHIDLVFPKVEDDEEEIEFPYNPTPATPATPEPKEVNSNPVPPNTSAVPMSSDDDDEWN